MFVRAGVVGELYQINGSNSNTTSVYQGAYAMAWLKARLGLGLDHGVFKGRVVKGRCSITEKCFKL